MCAWCMRLGTSACAAGGSHSASEAVFWLYLSNRGAHDLVFSSVVCDMGRCRGGHGQPFMHVCACLCVYSYADAIVCGVCALPFGTVRNGHADRHRGESRGFWMTFGIFLGVRRGGGENFTGDATESVRFGGGRGLGAGERGRGEAGGRGGIDVGIARVLGAALVMLMVFVVVFVIDLVVLIVAVMRGGLRKGCEMRVEGVVGQVGDRLGLLGMLGRVWSFRGLGLLGRFGLLVRLGAIEGHARCGIANYFGGLLCARHGANHGGRCVCGHSPRMARLGPEKPVRGLLWCNVSVYHAVDGTANPTSHTQIHTHTRTHTHTHTLYTHTRTNGRPAGAGWGLRPRGCTRPPPSGCC